MKVELIGGPLDGVFADCPYLECGELRATTMRATIFALLGEPDRRRNRHRVAVYNLARLGDVYTYRFQGVVYIPYQCQN